MTKFWTTSYAIQSDIIEYTVRWSPFGTMDKWVINRIIPSEAGIYQIWKKEGRGLVPILTKTVYYSGIRNVLREAIDDMAPAGRPVRDIMEGRQSWFRFSTIHSDHHLKLLQAWYDKTGEVFDAQGREVYVNEIDSMKTFPLPPSDIKNLDKKRLKESQFGPPLQKVRSDK